ncbi:MAG: hypothetical protein A2017_18225 [Lentisphaerae bacterium GWF2_44_16]|nr:MAG: hypothetical protein A2017_18225 [Lentisphaerae bacterium GWF2_44_16]
MSGFAITPPAISAEVPEQRNILDLEEVSNDAIWTFLSHVDLRTDRTEKTLPEILKKWVSKHYPIGDEDLFAMRLDILSDPENNMYLEECNFPAHPECVIAFEFGGPGDWVIGEKLADAEKNYPGLGQYILALLRKSPLDIYTFDYAFETLSAQYWDNGASEEEVKYDDERYEGTIKKADFDAEIPTWASKPSGKKYKGPLSFYDEHIEALKSATRRFKSGRKKFPRLLPEGAIPGALLFWKEIDGSIMQHIIDEDARQYQETTGTIESPGYFFIGGENFDYSGFVRHLEAYMDACTAVMEILKKLENISKLT